jgi:LPXTG-motif cell wall-anchored protein
MRATTDAERARIPPPPGTTTAAPLLAGLAVALAGLAYLLLRKR